MLLLQIIPSSLNEKIPFRPDFTKTRNLACYQCISDDMKSPYCANSMLLSAPEEVLVDYMFQCPYGQDEFCLKKSLKEVMLLQFGDVMDPLTSVITN